MWAHFENKEENINYTAPINRQMLDLLSMSASSAWPTLGSEPRYVSEPHPQAVEGRNTIILNNGNLQLLKTL